MPVVLQPVSCPLPIAQVQLGGALGALHPLTVRLAAPSFPLPAATSWPTTLGGIGLARQYLPLSTDAASHCFHYAALPALKIVLVALNTAHRSLLTAQVQALAALNTDVHASIAAPTQFVLAPPLAALNTALGTAPHALIAALA